MSTYNLNCLLQVSSEAMANIRTIAGLAKEKSFVESYNQQLRSIYESARRKANIYGFFFGLCQSVIFMTFAAAFRYGGYLVSAERLPYLIVFRLVK